LRLLMMQHILVGDIGHRENMRLVLRTRLEAILGMELVK